MSNCSRCNTPCVRFLRFVECNHILCVFCTADIIWGPDDGHFLCCFDPYCPQCGKRTDIVAEETGRSSNTLAERSLDTNEDNKKSTSCVTQK